MKNIAIMFTGLNIDTTSEITKAVRDCLKDNNANGFFFSSERRFLTDYLHDVGEYNIFSLPDFSKFDGVIVITSTINSPQILEDIWNRINEAGIPAVSIEDYRSDCYNVGIDNKSGMKELLMHFVVDHGYRRIAFLKGPLDNREANDRFSAYLEVLKENNIEYDEKLTFNGDFLRTTGRDAVDYFLSLEGGKPDAIVGANDDMVIGAMYRLIECGIRVPDEIALGGFDDSKIASEMQPALTSVAREQYQTGYIACKKLIEGYDDSEKGTLKQLKTRLVKRGSCGCVTEEYFNLQNFREDSFQKARSFEWSLDNLREMSIKLTAIDSLEAFVAEVKEWVSEVGFPYFMLTLCKEWEGYQHDDWMYDNTSVGEDYLKVGYGSACKQIIGYQNGHFYDGRDKDITDLIKELRNSDKGGHFFTVFPIHYQNRCFGYGIIGDDEFPYLNSLFYSWTMNLGNTLEIVRQHQLQSVLISKLNAMYIYDNLTGLYNRSGLMKYGSAIWNECIKKKQEALVLFMDADKLKYVNDTFGHENGDRLLVIVSGILNEVREHGEIVVRYGGDEFLLLSPYGSDEYAEKKKQLINNRIKIFNTNHDLPYDVSVSIGSYQTVPTSIEDMEGAIKAADKSMYEEKRAKKERMNGK